VQQVVHDTNLTSFLELLTTHHHFLPSNRLLIDWQYLVAAISRFESLTSGDIFFIAAICFLDSSSVRIAAKRRIVTSSPWPTTLPRRLTKVSFSSRNP
jgi:hypothetical protein